MLAAMIIVTVLVIGVHIAACAKENIKVRTWTKPFLVPLMGLTFFFALNRFGMTLQAWPAVLAALACYTIGDILLIPKERVSLFRAGMCFFALGHISFTGLFISCGMSGIALLIWAVIWISAFAFLFSPQLDWNDRETKYNAAYAVMVMLFGIAVGGSTFDGNAWGRVAACIGVIIFALSDSFVLYGQKKKTDMSAPVMVTYISAVALLLVSAFTLAS